MTIELQAAALLAAQASADPMLEARGLTKRFGSAMALDDVSLSVRPGEVVALLGANGAGKTTTISLFLGLLAPTTGQALVAGQDVSADPATARAALGYLPEVVSLYPTLTGIETLQYFNDLAGRPALAAADAHALLGRVGLAEDQADKRVGLYSKGMRQKVGLALALAKRARALVLDEPLSGLDPAAANDLVGLIKQVAAEGVAVLMATHDIFRAHDVADRLCIMRHGRLVATVEASALDAAATERLYLEHMRAA
jgi:ABC-2 type transport system ATP-binding protein